MKGLSQEELAVKLNVVRQTVSKWENGLSVPDSDMLICISQQLETPVCELLGETVSESEADDLKKLGQKLELINLQLARKKAAAKKVAHWFFIILFAVTLTACCVLIVLNSPYLGWDFSDAETAVMGTAFHAFEWLYIRLAPAIVILTSIGIFLTRSKR